jgi:hypothetical protein
MLGNVYIHATACGYNYGPFVLNILLEMAMGTRNSSAQRVLPDKEMGMELYFYPWVHKWATSCTHRVSGCGCGYILPILAYPRVK